MSNITLRVYGIPATVTENDFLHGIEAWLAKTFPRGSEARYITRWSFALVNLYGRMQNVATITLEETPRALHKGGNFVINLNERPYTLLFDSHFYGLTPLNNPSSIPTVEYAYRSHDIRGTMLTREFG